MIISLNVVLNTKPKHVTEYDTRLNVYGSRLLKTTTNYPFGFMQKVYKVGIPVNGVK